LKGYADLRAPAAYRLVQITTPYFKAKNAVSPPIPKITGTMEQVY